MSHCALCGSAEPEVIQTQSLALLNREQACRIDFCVCRSCGHLQQSPPVTPELMAHHYRSIAAYEEHGDARRLRAAPASRHAQRFLALVELLKLAPGRAYEVGCASGAMLHQFRKRGWRVGGCDLSPSAISQAKNIFRITAELGGEEETLPAQKDLDLILACHVLEHLYDPLAALGRCHAALAPGGHLVLEVPCAATPELLPPGWFTFEHLHYYQPATLEWLLRKSGFEILDTRIDSTAQHYPVIAIAARKGRAETVAPPEPLPGQLLAEAYAARDRLLWTATALRLACVQEPVFVYGAGIHTAQLLDRTRIAPNIIAIVDRDSKKWGQSQAGKTVISPAELFDHPSRAPVVISSYVSEQQIIAALLQGGITPWRIIPLYSQISANDSVQAAN